MDITALFQLSYGLYLVTASHEGKANGCIIRLPSPSIKKILPVG